MGKKRDYLKYKTRYLAIKKMLHQNGGNTEIRKINSIYELVDPDSKSAIPLEDGATGEAAL